MRPVHLTKAAPRKLLTLLGIVAVLTALGGCDLFRFGTSPEGSPSEFRGLWTGQHSVSVDTTISSVSGGRIEASGEITRTYETLILEVAAAEVTVRQQGEIRYRGAFTDTVDLSESSSFEETPEFTPPQMKFYVPTLGYRMVLEDTWKFTLQEAGGRQVADSLNISIEASADPHPQSYWKQALDNAGQEVPITLTKRRDD